MDDIAAMITQFLDSEEGMAQLRAVSQALGLGDPTAAGTASARQPGDFAKGDMAGKAAAPPAFAAGQPEPPPIDLNTLMMMQRAISMLGQEDKNTELLRALKPHFSQERAKKVDDAIKIMQLFKLLPMAREMGLFDRLKGGR